MRGIRNTVIALTAIAAIALGSVPAMADESKPDGLSPAVDRDLIVLPEELAAYGYSEEQIKAQQELIDALTPAQQAFQDNLRAEQDQLTAEALHGNYFDSQGRWVQGDAAAVDTLSEQSPQVLAGKPGEPGSDQFLAAITPNFPCADSDYRVTIITINGYYGRCYTGSGTLDAVSLDNIKSHRGGSLLSRVFYQHVNNYYWSNWRVGQTEYSFDDLQLYGSVNGEKVQRSYD